MYSAPRAGTLGQRAAVLQPDQALYLRQVKRAAHELCATVASRPPDTQLEAARLLVDAALLSVHQSLSHALVAARAAGRTHVRSFG